MAEALPVTAWGVAVTPYRPLSSLDRFSSYRRVTKFATARRATAPSGMSKRASIACYLYFSRANSPRGLLSRLSWLSESGWRELILKAAHGGDDPNGSPRRTASRADQAASADCPKVWLPTGDHTK